MASPAAIDAASTSRPATAINGRSWWVTASTTAPSPDAAGTRIIPAEPTIAGDSVSRGGATNTVGSGSGASTRARGPAIPIAALRHLGSIRPAGSRTTQVGRTATV